MQLLAVSCFRKCLRLLLLIGLVPALQAEVEVLARFEPASIAIGSASRYIVEIVDSGADAFAANEQLRSLPIPRTEGITLRNGQTSSSQETKISNGHAEYSITQKIIFDAIPAGTGSYTIPNYFIDYKNTRLQVPAATLNVVERSANADPAKSELIFLALETPDKLYVGQSKVITLKLYLASNIRIGDYEIERDADGFIVDGEDSNKPTESREIVNGRRYNVLSWPLTITPISAGKQNLNFQFTLIAQMPSQRGSRNNPFGNSIFDDFFGRSERITVYTEPTQVDVLPLPTESQPKSFSGAVGQFNMAVSADSKSTRVNEPIMLSLKLSGEGNFDRIQGPELPQTNGWRSYPPESVFETDAANKLKGTKRFDYIFVPQKAGTLELPELSFSFFDPDVEKYVELTSPAIAVEVAPSNIPPDPSAALSDSKASNETASQSLLTKSLSPEELLLTLDYRAEKGRTLPTGTLFTPLIYWLNGSLLVVLSVIGSIVYFFRKQRQDENYLRLKNAKQELKAVLKKTNSSDTIAFYSHAQKAVRLAAGIRTKQNLQSADLNELETKLAQLQLAEATIEDVRKLFHTADNLRFSGQDQSVDLSEARAQLNSILKAL